MTREEEIKKQADIYTDNASNYAEWSDDGGWSETNDIELIEKAFEKGAEWADSNPPKGASLIKWQTGEPKEEGVYIITTDDGEVRITSFHIGFSPDIDFFKICVVAWFKLSDIEPYKEE